VTCTEAAEMDAPTGGAVPERERSRSCRPRCSPYAIYGRRDHVQTCYAAYFINGVAFREDGDPRHPGYRQANDRQLLGDRGRLPVYLFFLLLAVTLVTNRLAQATKSYAD